MFRNVVRCISLVRVEKVQEELLAYAGSSFLLHDTTKKNCGNARFFHATLTPPAQDGLCTKQYFFLHVEQGLWCLGHVKRLTKATVRVA